MLKYILCCTDLKRVMLFQREMCDVMSVKIKNRQNFFMIWVLSNSRMTYVRYKVYLSTFQLMPPPLTLTGITGIQGFGAGAWKTGCCIDGACRSAPIQNRISSTSAKTLLKFPQNITSQEAVGFFQFSIYR